MSTAPPSTAGSSSERLTVRASTGVQGDGGVNFGKLVWIEGIRMYVQVDTALRSLEKVTLRVDLSPVPGTAMLKCTVMRVLPTAPGETSSYLVRNESVAPDDEQRWSQFLRVKRSGGTLSDLSNVRDSGSAMQPTFAPVAERERRAVLDRMGSGSTPPAGVSSASNAGASMSSTATWSSSAVNQGGGRAAMRDALKAALNRPAAAPAPSAPLGAPAAPGAARPPGAPTWPPVGMPPAPPPAPMKVPAAEDPVWVASNLGGTTYVQVEWRTPEAFSFDVHTQLSASILTLNSDGRPLPQVGTIYFVMKHQGILVQAKGAVSEHRGFTATYRLELDASHLTELRRGARSTSTVSGVGSTDSGRFRR